MRLMLLTSFNRTGNLGTEGLNNLSKVTQQKLEPRELPSVPMLSTDKLSYFISFTCKQG